MNKFSDELTSMIMPEYVRKMGMSIAPFSDLYNEKLYFQNDNNADLIKKIAHLLEYTNLVLFIQGAQGVGKTSIIKQRLLNKKENWKVCSLNAKDYVTTDTFVAKIAKDLKLHLSTDFIGSPAASLQEQLASLGRTGLFPVLIIDDIELLKDSLIPMLMSFIYIQENQRPILRLIVSGEDIPNALVNNLSNKDKEENIKYLPVLPLSQSETAEYIKFRMKAAGFEQKTPFSPEALKKIYLDAKGFPNLISQLANYYLVQYAQGKIVKQPLININDNNTLFKIATGILVFIVSIILISVFFNPSKNRETETLAIPSTVTKLVKSTKPEETIIKLSANTIIPKPKKVVKKPIIVKEERLATLNMKKEKENPVVTDSDEKWILSQNDNFYTLQLIGGSKKSSVLNYINRHNLKSDTHIFSTTRKGKPWFSVIYKSYPTRRLANAASTSLPKVLKQSQPWVRKFSQIKKEFH